MTFQAVATRLSGTQLDQLVLAIVPQNDEAVLRFPIQWTLPAHVCSSSSWNLRCIIMGLAQNTNDVPHDAVWGCCHASTRVHCVKLNKGRSLRLQSQDGAIDVRLPADWVATAVSQDEESFCFDAHLYQATTVLPRLGCLDVLPLPTELLTLVLHPTCVTQTARPSQGPMCVCSQTMDRVFGSFNHLGFCLVDLPHMKSIIEREFGSTAVNLVEKFTETDVIDRLFEEKVILVCWGIHAFNYEIVSIAAEDYDKIAPILGTTPENREGLYPIRKDLEKLSVVPGYELMNWPRLLEKNWPKIELYGNGETVHFQPFQLKDCDNETIIPSFLIYRSFTTLVEAQPLLNIDLINT